jgi:hypothetical protein
MGDQELFDIMEGRALTRSIDRILKEGAEEQRRERERNERPCAFTGGGDADECTHD